MIQSPDDFNALQKPRTTFQFVETLRRKANDTSKEGQSPTLDQKLASGGISFSSSSESQFTAVQLSSRQCSRKSSVSGQHKDKLEDFDSILASEDSFDVLSDFSFIEEDRYSKSSTLILTPVPHSAKDQSTATTRKPHRHEDVPPDVRISTIYTNLSSDTSQVDGNKESPSQPRLETEDSKLKVPQRGVTSATTWEGETDFDKLSPSKKPIGVVQTSIYCTQCQKEVLTDVLVRMKALGM